MPVHLIVGAVGAGKSTFAQELAVTLPAVRYTLDDWLYELFLVDIDLAAPEYAWIEARVQRCERRFVAQAAQADAVGIHTVLDIGLMEASQRERVAARCAEVGLEPTWYLLELPPEERWARVQRRNHPDRPPDRPFTYEVTREMFDFLEPRSTDLDGSDRFRAVLVGDHTLVRPADPGEAGVQEVLRAAFPGPDEAALVRELGPDHLLTLALEGRSDRTARAAATAFSLGGGSPGLVGVGPVAVHPAHQRRGHGSALMIELLRRLRGAGATGAVLLGDPAYYRRFGFAPADLHGVTSRWTGPAFQLAVLGDPTRGGPAPGRVEYPKAFDRFG